jgi:hypothetical protein
MHETERDIAEFILTLGIGFKQDKLYSIAGSSTSCVGFSHSRVVAAELMCRVDNIVCTRLNSGNWQVVVNNHYSAEHRSQPHAIIMACVAQERHNLLNSNGI